MLDDVGKKKALTCLRRIEDQVGGLRRMSSWSCSTLFGR